MRSLSLKFVSVLFVTLISSDIALGAVVFAPFQPPSVLFEPNKEAISVAPIAPTTASSSQNDGPFEVFISYRRTPSRNLAMLIKVMLQEQNVSAYLDVEDLRGGHWDDQLRAAIDESPSFILILGNGTLDRAKGDDNYTDFMHQEIKQAVDNEKRIILVFDDYNFPDTSDYSPEIQTALLNQGLTWQHNLVDQCIERIISYMREPAPFVGLKAIDSTSQAKLLLTS